MEVGDEGGLTVPFLDPTNKTGMSKQNERRKERGGDLFIFDFHTKTFKARRENMCLAVSKASSFEAPSLSTEMLSEIRVHAQPLTRDVYFNLTHTFPSFSLQICL